MKYLHLTSPQEMTLSTLILFIKRRATPACLCCFLQITAVFSQNGIVQGRIRDSAAGKYCSDCPIILMNKDSVFVSSTTTGRDGRFVLRDLTAGDRLLYIACPALDGHYLGIEVKAVKTIDIGTLSLQPKVSVLSTVIVTPKDPPPRLKGDTLEYNTTGINLRPNASVEELLRRLPGVRVDPDGSIYVNGRKIEKLLINGEEFFASNPTIATRTLLGEMIAKIQVIDQKSRQAEISGVDDRQRTNTLNLTLNDKSRNSLLVKADASQGDQGYYEADGLAAKFKETQQLAILGMSANTGNSGYNSTSGGIQAGLSVGLANNDPLGSSAGIGIPEAEAGGIHYANRWKGGIEHLQADGQVGHLHTSPYNTTQSIQILPDTTYSQNQTSQSVNRQWQENGKIQYDQKLDSLSSVYVTLIGQQMSGKNNFTGSTSSFFNDTLINTSSRRISSTVTNQLLQGGITYTRRSARMPARKWTFSINASNHQNQTNGFLYAPNVYYQAHDQLSTGDTTDQRKAFTTQERTIGGQSTLTQPVWKGAVIALKYTVGVTQNNTLQASFDRGNGDYQVYVDSLGTNFRSFELAQTATVNIQGAFKKLSYILGVSEIASHFKQLDRIKDSSYPLNFRGLAPMADFRIQYSSFSALKIGYYGNTGQPSPSQLLPLVNNNDPLHVTIGNASLRSSYSHTVSMGYQTTKPLFFDLTGRFSLTENDVSTRSYTDSVGKQVSEAVNVSGNFTTGFTFSLNKKLVASDVSLGMNGDLSYAHANSYVNNDLSQNNTLNGTVGITLAKYVTDKYAAQWGSNVAFNAVHSSINTISPIKYWSQSQFFQVALYPARTVEINGMISYSWREKTSTFDRNNTVVLSNAFVAKTFFKNNLTVRAQANNIFNQNTGITRMITGNQSTETRSKVIGRYFTLSLSYKFLHHPSGK